MTAATAAAVRQAFLASSCLLLCCCSSRPLPPPRRDCRRRRHHCCYYTVILNSKNPPKMRFKKFLKLTGLYLCLQQIDKCWIWRAYNDRKRKSSEFSETCLEKFVKSHQVNLFLAGFIWNHCVLQEGGEEEEGEGRRLWTDGRTNGRSTLLHMQYTFHYDGNRVNQAWNIEEFYDKIS